MLALAGEGTLISRRCSCSCVERIKLRICCSGPAIRKFITALEARTLAVAVLAELPIICAKAAACCVSI